MNVRLDMRKAGHSQRTGGHHQGLWKELSLWLSPRGREGTLDQAELTLIHVQVTPKAHSVSQAGGGVKQTTVSRPCP